MKTRSQTNDNKRKRSSIDDGSEGNDRSKSKPKPNQNNDSKRKQPLNDDGSQSHDSKFKPDQTDNSKRRRTSNDSGSEGNDRSEHEPKQKPRLTTPDLEFDYDRSQLRDPRPTPGRKARPRYNRFDIDEDPSLKAHIENDFTIPQPEKPKGRLNAFIKNDLFQQESLMNPAITFHDLFVCYKKGPRGSPTYDIGGFQLDYDKVCEWKKPRSYNKRSMVNGMQRAVEAGRSQEEQIAALFFTDGANEKTRGMYIIEHVRDHVSKDIGIPYHQIGVEKVKEWREKGFEPFDYESWWKEPNEVEKKRMSKMTMGSKLRKCV